MRLRRSVTADAASVATWIATIWHQRVIERRDKRLFLVSELLQAVRLVKSFASERTFFKRLDDARDDELKCMLYKRMAQVLEWVALWSSVYIVRGDDRDATEVGR